MWIDGKCNECGCLVIEAGSYKGGCDVMNSCSNPKCINYGWHHIDIESKCDYYVHGVTIYDDQLRYLIPENN